jgi:hypothetical protein
MCESGRLNQLSLLLYHPPGSPAWMLSYSTSSKSRQCSGLGGNVRKIVSQLHHSTH